MKVCQLCKNEGHRTVDCPDDPNKQSILPIEDLSDSDYEKLDAVLESVYISNRPSDQEVAHREEALNWLEKIIRKNFHETVELRLFGSSRNGFGFKGSDMDICLTFKNHKSEPPTQFSNPVEGHGSCLLFFITSLRALNKK